MDPPSYLAGIQPLPDDVLATLDAATMTPAQQQRARRMIARRARAIRAAREAHERKTGQQVFVEPPDALQ